MAVTSDSLSLVSYSDYRLYLRGVFDAKKRVNARFSFRRFAEIVGFKSPNYLQMILDGRRNLSVETAGQISSKLKFSAPQRDYFLALVQIEQAKSDQDKAEGERNRLLALKRIVSKEIPAAQKEVLSRWYHLLVRELFLLPRHKPEAGWISEMLAGLISREEAAASIEMLCRSGFLVADGASYRVAEPVLQTDENQLQAVFMRQHHAELLQAWAKNLDKLAPGEQELGVLNIPINSAKIPELRRRIRQFQDEIVGFVQSEDEADRVVQLGTYLIPFPRES